MAPRRSRLAAPWFDLARSTLKAAGKLSKAATRAAGQAARAQAPAIEKATRQMLTGVATPTPAPEAGGRGRWEEGRWGLGPLAQRFYRLYLPPGASLRRPVPLLMLLHGCGQDAASFAAATRAAANARAGGFAVLLPEQSSEANPQRCWNWFRPEPVLALETGILAALVEHVCRVFPLRRDQVFALGLSAGGAMAATLALRHPDLLKGIGVHSGALPGSAETPLQAGQSMRGRGDADLGKLRRHLGARLLPPLIVLHGNLDHTVSPANAEATTRLWLDLAPPGSIRTGPRREIRRGLRHPCLVTDWKRGGTPYVRQVCIRGLGHAWSGGAARQAFSDPRGPDALKMAWGFLRPTAG